MSDQNASWSGMRSEQVFTIILVSASILRSDVALKPREAWFHFCFFFLWPSQLNIKKLLAGR